MPRWSNKKRCGLDLWQQWTKRSRFQASSEPVVPRPEWISRPSARSGRLGDHRMISSHKESIPVCVAALSTMSRACVGIDQHDQRFGAGSEIASGVASQCFNNQYRWIRIAFLFLFPRDRLSRCAARNCCCLLRSLFRRVIRSPRAIQRNVFASH